MTTTRGFDLVGEFRSNVSHTITHAFWLAGILPSHFPLGNVGTFENLQIFLDAPSVRLRPGNAADALIADLRQRVVLRADNRLGEWTNELLISAPVALRDIVIGEVPAQMLVLDTANADAFQIAWARVTDTAPFEAIVNALIRAALAQPGRPIPIAPPIVGAPLRFFPFAGQDPLVLKLYCTLDGRDGTPPDGVQDALVDPFDPSQKGKDLRDDLAVAIDGGRLIALVNQALAGRGLVNGGVLINDGKNLINLSAEGDVTIDSNVEIPFFSGKITLPLKFDLSPKLQRVKLTSPIAISLGTGFVRLQGSVQAEIDNAFDVDADFDLRVGLMVGATSVTAFVQRAEIDVDTTLLQAIAASLFLPAAWLIADAVDKAIDTAASDEVAGKSFSENIPLRTFVLGDVALTNAETADRPVVLRVVPSRLFIRPDAVVLQMNVEGEAPGATPLVRPEYLIGHTGNKQFHQSGCTFGNRIKIKNRREFANIAEALAKGYDGCRNCLPQQDGEGVGRIGVMYWRTVGPGKKRSSPVSVSGTYVKGSKQPDFQKPWSLTGKLTLANSEGVWIDRFAIPDLAPGVWAVTLADGNWVVKKEVTVTGGKEAFAGFTYGKDAPPVDG